MRFWNKIVKDRFLLESFVLMILLWVFLTGLLSTVTRELNQLNHDNQQQVLLSNTTQQIRTIEHALLQVERFFESSEIVTSEEFQQFCTDLCTNDLFHYLYYADLGVITYVHPFDQQATLQDQDVIASFDATQLVELQMALDQDTSFYVYDDEVLLIYRPVQQDGVFRGLIAVSVPSDVLFDAVSNVMERSDVVFVLDDIVLSERTPESVRELTLETIDMMGISFQVGSDFHGGWYDSTLRWSVVIGIVLTALLLTIFLLLYRYRIGHLKYIEQTEHAKRYDIETGLKNRHSLYLDFDILRKQESGLFVAYGLFNNVKFIHYKYGHDVGTSVERAAIRLIEGVLRDGSTLYHLGGDEYVILINTSHKHLAQNILKRVLRVFEREIVIKSIRSNISLSLGVVSYPNEGETMEELIQNASLALGQSSNRNTNAYTFYDEVIHDNLVSLQEFDQLVNTLDLERFDLHFMPIARCQDNTIAGFECLSRAYNTFQERMNTPDVINALERNGRIQELDTIVFQKVVQHRLILNERLPGNDLFLSVNASALSLNETFVNTIIEMFVQSGLPQGSIVLELTESYKVEDYEYLIRLFQRLDHAGIRTAIDDFGSGYSSLSYVSRFPVYSIKLDKTYVREYQQNRFNRTLFLTVRSISQVLGAKLVAEGVDDPDTLDFLRHNRCEFYQGYLLSPGVPFEDAIRMYEDHNTKKE
jgi:diguanylate cyclase (GGDEF)-like protein